MREELEFSRNKDFGPSLIDSDILNGDKYQEQHALLQQFLNGEVVSHISDPASEAQARNMARRTGIELSPADSDLYVFMRGLALPFSDQVIFDEVLHVTGNKNRRDFRKFYPNIFPETAD